MSIAAYLVCPAREMSFFLGKRLRHEDGRMFGFSVGRHMAEEDPEHCAALFAFLADTGGEQIRVALSYEDDFEVLAGYTMVGGDAEDGDIPFADYLRSRAPGASAPRPTGPQPVQDRSSRGAAPAAQ